MAEETQNVIVQLENFTAGLIIAITLDLDANLRETTPVDTGWARANWVPRLGEPFAGNAGDVDPTPAQVASQSVVQSAALGEVLAYDLEDGPVFVSNNVPYITFLNDGSSDQEPEGFVQRAITKAINNNTSARES